ncbi:MAG TPA: aspartyl-phosphate phosphatase Spo0E family protein [Bacillota bacterium]|nr:aspartyl-phosphate phosphatase Spo0E family protein [Bacillota bacterium]
MTKTKSICSQIEQARKQMIQLARTKGYTSKKTIEASRRLDHLMNRYQKLQQNKSTFTK